MDPNYVPSDIETRQVYGISLQQRRNDVKIESSLFKNIVTKNTEVRPCLPSFPYAPLCQASG
jgi:phosphoribosylaminoimidazolecarboxamide formyltransferase/IMP cyclohydrolase